MRKGMVRGVAAVTLVLLTACGSAVVPAGVAPGVRIAAAVPPAEPAEPAGAAQDGAGVRIAAAVPPAEPAELAGAAHDGAGFHRPARALACQPCRVGLQAGHWRSAELPDELWELREQTGGDFGAWREIDVTLPVAKAAAELLRQAGVIVDVLPATVPPGYRANAFVSVHSDRDMQQRWRGYKLAASALSANASGSGLLADGLAAEYAALTQLPLDVHKGAITPGMRFYYAFNSRRFEHAIDARTPAAIVETGFVSDAADRGLLFGRQSVVAEALVRGIERFLAEPGA